MKPVRRRIRSHFGLTAKQVAVRSKRPWYFQWGVAVIFIVLGYVSAYWQFTGGGESIRDNLKQATLENQALNTKVIQTERQLQIEQAAQVNLTKALNQVQDENIHIKEELVFYKQMLNGKK
ncbi:MAG: hypothetical protein Q8N02_04020 [Methylotenera sp.]|nr:hypothetical protein [Methylotenera sp.]MDO9233786.1 hypothetical protein [Methylotenera sp.]MDO9388224.1 hypothetical protein [Methylotenera sp.]MDP2101995.1 hypothetical protein [Methylotenera sp.]MDP2282023.1 hypothetical protein [Methylotenera sp.]